MFEEILKLANKFVPNKESQAAFMVELQKLEIEDFKNKQNILEKVIPVTFPILVWVMVAGLISNLLGGWISLIFKCETPIYKIEPYHYELIKVFCVAFFSKRTIEQFSSK